VGFGADPAAGGVAPHPPRQANAPVDHALLVAAAAVWLVLHHSAVVGVGDEHVSGGVDRHPVRNVHVRAAGDHALGVATAAVRLVLDHPVVEGVGDEHVPGGIDRDP